MRITADHYLKMGRAHWICQDYLLSGTGPLPHLIVADGCSSSEETDVGARILAHSARGFLKDHAGKLAEIGYGEMGEGIVQRAGAAARMTDLSPTALDATLMIAYADVEENGAAPVVTVRVYGDGVIVAAGGDGRKRIIEISFSGNAPYYLSYRLDAARNEVYRQQNFSKGIRDREITTEMKPDAAAEFRFSLSEYPILLLATDGISSFIDSKGKKIGIEPVAEALTAFKNRKGAFVKRRAKRAIRDFEKMGITHYDDIAVGAFLGSSGQSALDTTFG